MNLTVEDIMRMGAPHCIDMCMNEVDTQCRTALAKYEALKGGSLTVEEVAYFTQEAAKEVVKSLPEGVVFLTSPFFESFAPRPDSLDEWLSLSEKPKESEEIQVSKETRENCEAVKEVLQGMMDLYAEKNRRYGNSAGKQFEKFGLLSTVIRLNDKLQRLEYLAQHPDDFGDESAVDTLTDLANYAVIALAEIKKEKSKCQ